MNLVLWFIFCSEFTYRNFCNAVKPRCVIFLPQVKVGNVVIVISVKK